MSDVCTILVDGRPVRCAPGMTVAAAMLNAGISVFRHAGDGAGRGPVCGMGICLECVVEVEGRGHRRACLEDAVDGLRVRTRA